MGSVASAATTLCGAVAAYMEASFLVTLNGLRPFDPRATGEARPE